MTPTELALVLHTDLVTIKAYGDKSPAVTRAVIAEAETKLDALRDHLVCVRKSLVAAEAPLIAA